MEKPGEARARRVLILARSGIPRKVIAAQEKVSVDRIIQIIAQGKRLERLGRARSLRLEHVELMLDASLPMAMRRSAFRNCPEDVLDYLCECLDNLSVQLEGR